MNAKGEGTALQIEIAEAFEAMESEAAKQPGVLDVLRVYGDYDAALKQADAYLSVTNPLPKFSTTNTSG